MSKYYTLLSTNMSRSVPSESAGFITYNHHDVSRSTLFNLISWSGKLTQ